MQGASLFGLTENFMVEAGLETQGVGWQANDRKGLHYISDFISVPFVVAGTWGERMRGGGWAGNAQQEDRAAKGSLSCDPPA